MFIRASGVVVLIIRLCANRPVFLKIVWVGVSQPPLQVLVDEGVLDLFANHAPSLLSHLSYCSKYRNPLLL